MDISVIVPTYKPQSYLWVCLDSLCRQTFPKHKYEVILVLNGCLEPYKSLIEDYIEKHKDLQWNCIHESKGGVSNARNVALNAAKGEYITFVDDDDFISPVYLEELYNAAAPETVSLCYPLRFTDGTSVYEQYNITDSYQVYSTRERVSIYDVRSYFSGPVYKLIHRNIIQNKRYDCRLRNGEDTLFMFAISNGIKNISFTSEKAIYYRRDRVLSAANRKRSLLDKFSSNIIQIVEYIKLYIKSPFNYNIMFFTTRIGGALLGIVR